MPKPKNSLSTNHILAGLNEADAALLAPHLEAVDLPRRRQLEIRARRFEYAYFPDSGVASVVADGASLRSVEVGMIGREGITGLGAVMGAARSPYDTFMQVPGAGRRISAAHLRECMDQSPTFRAAILRFAYAFTLQVTQTALNNARSKIEERMARWLLMVHDRIQGDDMRLTHEFLATMLGVRRAGVSVAMKALEQQGLVTVSRGVITIADREGLEANAGSAYGDSERIPLSDEP